MANSRSSRCKSGLAFLFCATIVAGSTGCQMHIGGQTLPSPYYQQDDVQYFPHGHEFNLFEEATAMEVQEQELLDLGVRAGQPPLQNARRPGFTRMKPY